jgi:hypothetical protein
MCVRAYAGFATLWLTEGSAKRVGLCCMRRGQRGEIYSTTVTVSFSVNSEDKSNQRERSETYSF